MVAVSELGEKDLPWVQEEGDWREHESVEPEREQVGVTEAPAREALALLRVAAVGRFAMAAVMDMWVEQVGGLEAEVTVSTIADSLRQLWEASQ